MYGYSTPYQDMCDATGRPSSRASRTASTKLYAASPLPNLPGSQQPRVAPVGISLRVVREERPFHASQTHSGTYLPACVVPQFSASLFSCRHSCGEPDGFRSSRRQHARQAKGKTFEGLWSQESRAALSLRPRLTDLLNQSRRPGPAVSSPGDAGSGPCAAGICLWLVARFVFGCEAQWRGERGRRCVW
jgi:hypothetical protein